MKWQKFKLGKHTLSLFYSPSHKLFAIKSSGRGGDTVMELHLGKIGGWYCYRPQT